MVVIEIKLLLSILLISFDLSASIIMFLSPVWFKPDHSLKTLKYFQVF